MDADVVVVGAGPAGAAVSTLLARQGHRVILLDRCTFPRDKACAEYLSPACSPILERLGVLDAVVDAAPQRLQGMRVTDYRGQACWGRFIDHGRALYGLALPRIILDDLLVRQACQAGAELHTGVWVRQLLHDGQHVYGVQGRAGARSVTLQARVVIAADGVHSTLARRLGLVRRVRWLQHVALVTHYRAVRDMGAWGEMFLIPGGYIGLAPVGDDCVNVSLVMRASRFASLGQRPEEALEQVIQTHSELVRRFTGAVRSTTVLTTGPMAQRLAPPQHDGILFAGDAAGFIDPFTGQGIFLALHSAELAADVVHQALQRGDVSAQMLQRYVHAHHQAFHQKYLLSAGIQCGLRVPWITNAVIARLAQRPTLADTVVSVTGDFLSPREVLSWRFARRMIQPLKRRASRPEQWPRQ
jgi:geranylgeranyl reductase family protein